jgi:hypothetical protein
MKNTITNYIRAGYPGLYLVSSEEQRVDAELKAIALELQYNLHIWSVLDGLVDVSTGQCRSATDPIEALAQITELKEKSIILLRDYSLTSFPTSSVVINRY